MDFSPSSYQIVQDFAENEFEDEYFEARSKWLLGKRYFAAEEEDFIRDFKSIVWCSYRNGFPQMSPYPITSDRGWGCMLRAAQMILAQGLIRHIFTREWRTPLDIDHRQNDSKYCKVLEWFVDHPSGPLDCLFSLHNMVLAGMQYDMLPGEWYGPSDATKVLRDLFNAQEEKLGLCLAFLVCDGGSIYRDVVNKAVGARQEEQKSEHPVPIFDEEMSPDGNLFHDPLLNPPKDKQNMKVIWEKGVLLFLPLRLGIDSINPDYQKGLLKTLEFPQSLGIIGGRPNHAIYFVGHENESFLGLDPHTVQPSPDPANFPSASYLMSVQRDSPQILGVDYLDPSVALGFYCRNAEEFQDLCSKLCPAEGSGKQGLPINIANSPPYIFECFDEGIESDCEDDYVVIEKHL